MNIFKMSGLAFGLLLSMSLTTGCMSRVPLAMNHQISVQKKAKATHHWDLLAADVADQVITLLMKKGLLGGNSIYVENMEPESQFGTTFRELLITQLVNKDVKVSTEKTAGTIDINFETQIVSHNSSRYTPVPGLISMLTAGIWVVRDAAAYNPTAIPVTAGGAVLVDYGRSLYAGPETNTEVLVTTSILHELQYAFRKTDIYYIEPEDSYLFEAVDDSTLKHIGVTNK